MILALELIGTLIGGGLLIYAAVRMERWERRKFFEKHGRYPNHSDYIASDDFR